MNRFMTEVIHLEGSGSFSLVDLRFGDTIFSSIIMERENELPWLKVGNRVQVLFKATEVSLAVGEIGRISLRNRMTGPVRNLEKGQIMSRIELEFQGHRVVSIITTRSVEALGIREGMEVTALVKASEIVLMQPEEKWT